MSAFFLLASITLSESGLRAPLMSKCCDNAYNQDADSVLSLMRCVNESIVENEKSVLAHSLSAAVGGPTLTVGLVTYASENIWPYAAYSLAVNGAYAEQNGYAIRLIDPNRSNPEPKDARWNKVALLLEALEPRSGWGRDLDYLVWIDADLIFLDLDLRLEAIAVNHPGAHILVSAEHAGSSTLMNSGAVLVRNCAWTRTFLKNWWDFGNRLLYSDQEQFDLLYYSLPPSERAKIAVLPPDALNTDPPAMTTLRASSKVLHLMGDHTPFRRTIFERGLAAVCTSVGDAAPEPPPQLGINRTVLLAETLRTYSKEVETDLPLFMERASRGEGTLKDARYLANAVHHVAHAVEVGHAAQSSHASLSSLPSPLSLEEKEANLEKATASRVQVFEALYLNVQRTRERVQYIDHKSRSENATLERIFQDWPELLKCCAEAGQNLVHCPRIELFERQRYATLVLTLLDEIMGRCHVLQRPAVQQMRASMVGQVGHLARESGDLPQALSHFEEYLSLARDVATQAGEHITLEPLSLVATTLASLGRIHKAIPLYEASLDISSRTVGREHRSTAVHLINLGMARTQSGDYAEGAEMLREGMAVLQMNGVDVSESIYTKAAKHLALAQKTVS